MQAYIPMALADNQLLKFANGVPNTIRQYVPAITIGAGIILIIVGLIQVARYIGSKSNGGGQSRVSIGWAVASVIVGGFLFFGGASAANTLGQMGQDSITEVSKNGEGGVKNKSLDD